MKHLLKIGMAMLVLFAVAQSMSCKEEKVPEVIASFTYAVDATDYMKVTFTNQSQNFSALAWDFGDGTTSTEASPVHTYAALGTFTVKLTATNNDGSGTDMYSEVVTITDPNAELTKLVGAGNDGKTWKLLRDVSGGVYPLQCGPYDHSSIWWAMGLGNDELANRPCIMNDEFTFKRDGSLIIDRKGDYWAEGGIYLPANICASTADPMVGEAGEDLSAWAGGTHTFTLDGANKKITANGSGAFIGFEKLGNGAEVMNTRPVVPPASVTYDIISLYDGTTDTLIVQGRYQWDASDGGYWRFVLVHYDNPADEPPLPGNKPSIGYTLAWAGKQVTCTNTTTGADSYLWDWGNGETSTAASPTYTYPAEGMYTITLTATNTNGSSTMSTVAFVTETEITDALLQGGSWKVPAKDMRVFCGGGMGLSNWWPCPKANLDGTNAGTTDDWSCMTDDEFIFSTGGVFEYKTNGSARNDGWFQGTNGCITDAEIAALPAPGPAFGSGIHSYSFTPPSGGNRAIIVLTNGATGAAFLGFMKGYYGGENTNYTTQLPNGGNATNQYEVMGYANDGSIEYLFVTCDITADHTGTGSWSTILERSSKK
ncbi:MAG TPA: PKD domain-containing protein [Bacteroidales bacterium]|jgi:PKD repeat protein|nr:PKD domain-containing protein [Bacteroidales bacterium]